MRGVITNSAWSSLLVVRVSFPLSRGEEMRGGGEDGRTRDPSRLRWLEQTFHQQRRFVIVDRTSVASVDVASSPKPSIDQIIYNMAYPHPIFLGTCSMVDLQPTRKLEQSLLAIHMFVSTGTR